MLKWDDSEHCNQEWKPADSPQDRSRGQGGLAHTNPGRGFLEIMKDPDEKITDEEIKIP